MSPTTKAGSQSYHKLRLLLRVNSGFGRKCKNYVCNVEMAKYTDIDRKVFTVVRDEKLLFIRI